MVYIKSCGFVAYKVIDNINYYLIIKSKNGDIGFPKGHVEFGETEIETAKRELKEETNIEVNLIDGFRYQIEYPLLNKKDVRKQSVYFLGECVADNIVIQETEVLEVSFVSYEEALKLLTFEETKEILVKAEKFIRER